MNSPRIEFHEVSSRLFCQTSSTREVIRFRVTERKGSTNFDADWFVTDWELAPAARDAIFSRCEPIAQDWGGGVACLIIRTQTPTAHELKLFLAEILANPDSWLRWSRERQAFLPLPCLEVAA